MDTGAVITRGTIWLALLCYVAALALRAHSGMRGRNKARALWLMGCLSFLAHIAAAFHFYHHWSHAAALEDTRRQTLAQTGIDYGGGIYFNYLFALVWLTDCTPLAWRRGLLQEQHRAWYWFLHAFFLFMIFNATAVFGHGLAKPIGALVCAATIMWLWRARSPLKGKNQQRGRNV